MIRRFVTRIACRLTGWACSPDRPSSRDLRKEMQDRGRKVEATAIELRRQRNVIESAFRGQERGQHGR